MLKPLIYYRSGKTADYIYGDMYVYIQYINIYMVFPGGSDGEQSAYNA